MPCLILSRAIFSMTKFKSKFEKSSRVSACPSLYAYKQRITRLHSTTGAARLSAKSNKQPFRKLEAIISSKLADLIDDDCMA